MKLILVNIAVFRRMMEEIISVKLCVSKKTALL